MLFRIIWIGGPWEFNIRPTANGFEFLLDQPLDHAFILFFSYVH
jgi:hypothetical protein